MDSLRGIWRGKRLDNNEWVNGYLIRDKHESFICNITSYYPVSFKPHIVAVHVDTETLGECIGLCDYNGTSIFEGDICTVAMSNIAEDEYGVVKYDESEAVFVVDFGTYTINFCNNVNGYAVEIIGNIHDNPELLRATGEDIGNAANETILPAT